MNRAFLPVVLVALGAVAPAGAKERSVRKAEVPAAVIAALQEKFGGAAFSAWRIVPWQGTEIYRANVKDAIWKHVVGVTAGGKIVFVETEIKRSELPERVERGFKACRYGTWPVKSIVRRVLGEKQETATFTITVSRKDLKYEVTLNSAGQVVEKTDRSDRKDGKKKTSGGGTPSSGGEKSAGGGASGSGGKSGGGGAGE
jgi:uncharacterized membrane protein YgcG